MCQVTFPETHLSFSLRVTFLTVGNFLRGIYKVNYFLQCYWVKWSSQNPDLSLLRARGSCSLRHSEGLLCCLSSAFRKWRQGKGGRAECFRTTPSSQMVLCLRLTGGLSPLQQASFVQVLFLLGVPPLALLEWLEALVCLVVCDGWSWLPAQQGLESPWKRVWLA